MILYDSIICGIVGLLSFLIFKTFYTSKKHHEEFHHIRYQLDELHHAILELQMKERYEKIRKQQIKPEDITDDFL